MSTRSAYACGEAKAGETIGVKHLARLERLRAALGVRAVDARLLLFGVEFSEALNDAARSRTDVELVGLERLYCGE